MMDDASLVISIGKLAWRELDIPFCQQSVDGFRPVTYFCLQRFDTGAMVEVGTGSPDGVAPSRMVSVSATVNLPLHHKVQKFSTVTGWSWKKGRKTVVLVVML